MEVIEPRDIPLLNLVPIFRKAAEEGNRFLHGCPKNGGDASLRGADRGGAGSLAKLRRREHAWMRPIGAVERVKDVTRYRRSRVAEREEKI